MLLHEINGFKPAILKKGYRWYLEYSFIDIESGEWIRKRESYNLNRIKDLRLREQKFRKIQNELNKKLASGWPYREQVAKKKKEKKKKKKIKLSDGIQFALDIKLTSNRTDSHRTYNSKARIFLEWAKKRELLDIPVRHFSTVNAVEFLNYVLVEREVGAMAWNNYLTFIKGFFAELKNEKYIKKNPFDGIPRKKPGDKKRRAFARFERKIVSAYCQEHFPILFLGIVLQYYCFIRPGELRRMRVGDIDIENGVILLSSDQTKNKKQENVTIPDVAIPFLEDAPALKYPPHFLIFGKNVAPHECIPCGERTLNNQQREYVLKPLFKKKTLKNIKGLSFYSWKDTGAYELVKNKVNIIEIMKQLRHASLEVTQRYCNSLYSVNKEVKALKNDLL